MTSGPEVKDGGSSWTVCKSIVVLCDTVAAVIHDAAVVLPGKLDDGQLPMRVFSIRRQTISAAEATQ